jgi:hypothetical protein
MSSPNKQPNDFYKYTSMSFKMGAVIAGGALGGYYADAAIGWKFPLFTLVLSLTGVALAIYIVIADTKR